MIDKLKSIVIDEIEKNSIILKQSNFESWIILYKGNQIMLPSGKSVWSKIGDAKLALGYHIGFKVHRFIREKFKELNYTERRKIFKNVIDELIKDGIIEFKKL